jgi:hypothetical protein
MIYCDINVAIQNAIIAILLLLRCEQPSDRIKQVNK